jgi:hypothetical protein
MLFPAGFGSVRGAIELKGASTPVNKVITAIEVPAGGGAVGDRQSPPEL